MNEHNWTRWSIVKDGGTYLVVGEDVCEAPEEFEDYDDAVDYCDEMNETKP